MVGFEEFNAYDGTNEGDGVSKTFAGLAACWPTTQFSVTVKPEYANYYYAISYAGFSPFVKELWCGDYDIADDGEGCYFTDGFYNKTGDSFDMAAHIVASSNNTDTTYACSGPYVVESYDEGDKSAILTLNPNFPGNYEGAKPSIAKVIYKKSVSATQLDDLKSGGVDVLMGITRRCPRPTRLSLPATTPTALSFTPTTAAPATASCSSVTTMAPLSSLLSVRPSPTAWIVLPSREPSPAATAALWTALTTPAPGCTRKLLPTACC